MNVAPRRVRAQAGAHLQLLLWRHGWAGPAALACLLLAALLWLFQIEPAGQRLAVLQERLRAPQPPATALLADRAAATDAERIAALRGVLRPYAEQSGLVRRISALTGTDLHWDQADFQQSSDPVLGTVRVQIALKAVGDYRQARRALDSALREVPNLSLDQVSFRREQGTQTRLETRISLSLWLLAPEGSEPPREALANGVAR